MSTNQSSVDSSQKSVVSGFPQPEGRLRPKARGNDGGAVQSIGRAIGSLKRAATDAGSEIGAWLAPLPSAVSVAMAAHRNLNYEAWLAFIVGAIVELLGFATANRALELWYYNQTRRSDEPKAPTWIAVVLVVFYLFATISLSVLADLLSGYVHFLPALFPLLAVTGTLNVALGRQQALRVERNRQAAEERQTAEERAEAERKADEEKRRLERKADRELKRQLKQAETTNDPLFNRSIGAYSDKGVQSRRDKYEANLTALLDAYRDNRWLGPSEAARRFGVTRQTIDNWRDELEKRGLVHENGNGVEVKP